MKLFKTLSVISIIVLLFIGCTKQDTQKVENTHQKITNKYWKLTQIENSASMVYPKQREAHILLKEQKVAGSDGCNRIMGSYTLNENKITFSRVASTMMACLQGMQQAYKFKINLEKAQNFKIENDKLLIFDKDSNKILEFTAIYLQ
ncbi:hypothetical protein CP985_11330 [Malaciobacter mytili LMG 24559]|uniref:DUF306 domain-containing protein n=1 Tax=Malaciobacter mytili LMG 24559 TaxID=1032238 RepID=A0AAX2ADI5_9BACT|nr:META domain-containing protein [Malaciobacter mytili]AXH16073.1 META domain-containing protein [Malaciobacter mytili LMG 24559]RXK14948.1 hypothetical protein CP985_11330 [Malaciobacter mytili LMG 24559]